MIASICYWFILVSFHDNSRDLATEDFGYLKGKKTTILKGHAGFLAYRMGLDGKQPRLSKITYQQNLVSPFHFCLITDWWMTDCQKKAKRL